MKILAFDTCFSKSYITLSIGSDIIQSKIIESNENNYHSVYLIPEIRNLLVKNNLSVKDLDAIGVNIGPGSFTGIRASVVIARVLCQQFNIKLAGVNSLTVLSNLNKDKNHTTVILDARKNKVYFGEYNNSSEISPPCLIEKSELLLKIKPNSFIISDCSIGNFLEQNGINYLNHEQINENYGMYLIKTVQEMLKNRNDGYNWAQVRPLYLQKPSITKPKEKINVL